MALQDRKRFAGFLRGAIGDWLDFLALPYMTAGVETEEAYAFATVTLAGFRGFLMDLCATRDVKRIDRAVDLWLSSNESWFPEELPDAK